MTTPDLHLQDERANVEGICGHIVKSPGYEWICVRKAHASTERPWVAANHYIVNRWPNRPGPLPTSP